MSRVALTSDRESLVTLEEMRAAKIPGALRDYCAHLLIPMNACRREHGFLPWTCSTEKHEYERCTYIEWLKAKAKKDERLGR